MKTSLFIPATIASLALATTAHAAHSVDTDLGKYYAGGMVHLLTTDHTRFADQGANDGFGGRLMVGMKMTDRISTELSLGTQSIDLTSGASKDQQEIALDVRLQFGNGPVRSFMLVGGGKVRSDMAGGTEEDHTLLRFGVGFDFEVADKWDVRAQVAARHEYDITSVAGETNFTDFEMGVGVVRWFGGNNDVAKFKPEPQPVVAQAPTVTTTPKPKPKPIVAAPKPMPKPMPKPTAPRDTDRDGVIDGKDNCAGTAAGALVDINGCDVADLRGANSIRFGFDSTSVGSTSAVKLDRIASLMKRNPQLNVELVGHADNAGPLAYNVQLSERRAKAAKEYLTMQGIASSRIRTQAYGETRPFGDNSTAAGRADNRRVEVLFQR